MRSARFVCLFAVLASALAPAQSNSALLGNQPSGLARRAESPTQNKIVENYGKLPLSFEANQGQTDARVKFLSRGIGYTLFLTSDEAVFSLRGSESDDKALPRGPRLTAASGPTPDAVLRMKLHNANQKAEVSGLDELPGKSDYFIGNDPKKWHTNVPAYAKVKYEGVYSGIDLFYYGNPEQLEYDFVVAPGADPRRIQFDVQGAKQMRRDRHGDLVLQVEGSEVRWHKPIVYQQNKGTRQAVEGRYVIKRGHRVGFEVANYDRTSPLVIDPAITYSTYLGGATNLADAYRVAADAEGNAYLTGYTRAWDFPVTPGAFQTSCPSGNGQYECGTWGAAFITKMNPAGTALVYSTYLGGNEGAQGSAITIDASGDAYVTGGTDSNNFPTTPGAFQATCTACGYYQGLGDAFVTELNPTGSALVYSTYLGGNTGNQNFNSNGNGIAIDPSGVYVVGSTNFGGFPVTPSAFQTKCGSCQQGPGLDNAFITKFDPTLSSLVYSTFLGGSASDGADSMVLDAAGDVYLTGTATSTNFPVTQGAFQTTCSSPCFDAFVTELNPTGSAVVYSTYLGGSVPQGSGQWGSGIAVDASGDAYVTGETGSSNFPTTPGAFQTTCHGCVNGGGNAFVTEFNSTGSALVYSTYLGGSIVDIANGIALDAAGNTYLSGETFSVDFPTTPGSFQPTCGEGCSVGKYRGFVSELNAAGSALVYSTYLTGTNGSGAWGIAMDAAASFYVVGATSSTDFPVTPGAFQPNCAGGCEYYGNAFITKFVQGDQVWPLVLNLGSEPTGVSSSPQNTVLTNSAPTALDITSIAITGVDHRDFSQKNNCGKSLPAGDHCTITVVFDPFGLGTRDANVTITDNAPNSPQTVPLSGVGTAPIVTLSPPSLNFGNQPVGTTSSPQIIQLSTSGKLSISRSRRAQSLARLITAAPDCPQGESARSVSPSRPPRWAFKTEL